MGRFLATLTRSLSLSRRTGGAAPQNQQETTTSSSKYETDLAERLSHLSGLGDAAPHLNWLTDAFAILLSSLRLPSASYASDNGVDASLPLLIDASRALSRFSLSLLQHLSRFDSALLRSLSLPYSAASRRLSAASSTLKQVSSGRWQADLDQAAHSLLLLRKQMMKPRSATHHSASDLRGAILSAALLLGAATVTLSRIAGGAVDRSRQNRRLLAPLDGLIGSSGAAWGMPLRQLQRELLASAVTQQHQNQEEAAGSGLPGLQATMAAAAALLLRQQSASAEIGNVRKGMEELRGSMAAVHAQSSGVSRALADLRVSMLDAAVL